MSTRGCVMVAMCWPFRRGGPSGSGVGRMPARLTRVVSVLAASAACVSCITACPGGGPNGIDVAAGEVAIHVDASRRFQTWVGMEAATEFYHRDDNALGPLDMHPVPQQHIDAMIDDAVDNLGLTTLDFPNALLKLSRNRQAMEPVNDNADPFVLDSSKIRWHWFDPYMRSVVLPFKQKVESSGEPFVLTLTAIAWDAYHWRLPASDPGQEYAEFMMAVIDRMANMYGVVPDFVSVYNEPDLGIATETRQQVVQGIQKFDQRLKAAGYATKIRFPDTENVSRVVDYLDAMETFAPGLSSSLGVLSFHGYGGLGKGVLNQVRARANALGIPTAQSEWWFTNYHPPDIHRAMTEANVTQYQPYALVGISNNANQRGLYRFTFSGGTYPLHNYTGFARSADWYEIYQYSAFIRPGDVRIEATTQPSYIKPVAFRRPNGKQTLVVVNQAASQQTLLITGLPAGTYGVSITSSSQQGEEQVPLSIGFGQTLRVPLPGRSVSSIYAQ